MIEITKEGVRLCGKDVPMTRMEQNLLLFFLRHPNTDLSRAQLLQEVWGYAIPGSTRTVDTHVKSLRAHLGKLGRAIVTVRGVGYRMNLDPQPCRDCDRAC